jgi:hypothetical protein
MQGLVVLHDNFAGLNQQAGRDRSPIDDTVARFTNLIVNGLRA